MLIDITKSIRKKSSILNKYWNSHKMWLNGKWGKKQKTKSEQKNLHKVVIIYVQYNGTVTYFMLNSITVWNENELLL